MFVKKRAVTNSFDLDLQCAQLVLLFRTVFQKIPERVNASRVPYGVGRLSARNDETVAVGGVCDLQREGGRKMRNEEREREKGVRGKEGDGDLSEKRGERGRKKKRSK